MQLKVLQCYFSLANKLLLCLAHYIYLTPSTVEDLERCNAMVGTEEDINNSKHHTAAKHGEPSKYFPFKQGYLAIATLRVGSEGIHMTVDGKHVTSFAYRAVNFFHITKWIIK